jgi:hypothetical protein
MGYIPVIEKSPLFCLLNTCFSLPSPSFHRQQYGDCGIEKKPNSGLVKKQA